MKMYNRRLKHSHDFSTSPLLNSMIIFQLSAKCRMGLYYVIIGLNSQTGIIPRTYKHSRVLHQLNQHCYSLYWSSDRLHVPAYRAAVACMHQADNAYTKFPYRHSFEDLLHIMKIADSLICPLLLKLIRQ